MDHGITRPRITTTQEGSRIMNGTSGVSALTGGNCTREEYNADHAHEAALRAIGWVAWSDEPRGPDQESWPRPYDNLAADLEERFDNLAAIFASAGARLTDEEHELFEHELTELGGTVIALRR
jgi:hypothetical protein